MLTGSWGVTFFGGRPVLEVILERVPATMILMSTSLALAIVIGTAVGWWLDDTLGTSPICFFIFFFLGLAAGVLNVYRTMSRIK